LILVHKIKQIDFLFLFEVALIEKSTAIYFCIGQALAIFMIDFTIGSDVDHAMLFCFWNIVRSLLFWMILTVWILSLLIRRNRRAAVLATLI
jgi:hypothetical protein